MISGGVQMVCYTWANFSGALFVVFGLPVVFIMLRCVVKLTRMLTYVADWTNLWILLKYSDINCRRFNYVLTNSAQYRRIVINYRTRPDLYDSINFLCYLFFVLCIVKSYEIELRFLPQLFSVHHSFRVTGHRLYEIERRHAKIFSECIVSPFSATLEPPIHNNNLVVHVDSHVIPRVEILPLRESLFLFFLPHS